jgi:hypothetical protein
MPDVPPARPRRPLCSDLSRENSEPISATASRIDYWLLIEYRGLWGRAPLGGSGLSDEVKDHVRRELGGHGSARLLFVKRPERRGREGIRVFYGSTRAEETRFFRRVLTEYDELLDLNLRVELGKGAEPLEHPLFVVCTHGKRDRCCAVYGRPLYEALRDELDEDWVWQATHVGGDRFAANVVVLPGGHYFGRVGPESAAPLANKYLADELDLEHYRGRCWYPFPAQAAESALRSALDLTGIGALELAHAGRDGDRWQIAFRTPDGAVYERTVVSELGELTYLTCDAHRLQRPRRYRALSS